VVRKCAHIEKDKIIRLIPDTGVFGREEKKPVNTELPE
jgi:hypothetical protein